MDRRSLRLRKMEAPSVSNEPLKVHGGSSCVHDSPATDVSQVQSEETLAEGISTDQVVPSSVEGDVVCQFETVDQETSPVGMVEAPLLLGSPECSSGAAEAKGCTVELVTSPLQCGSAESSLEATAEEALTVKSVTALSEPATPKCTVNSVHHGNSTDEGGPLYPQHARPAISNPMTNMIYVKPEDLMNLLQTHILRKSAAALPMTDANPHVPSYESVASGGVPKQSWHDVFNVDTSQSKVQRGSNECVDSCPVDVLTRLRTSELESNQMKISPCVTDAESPRCKSTAKEERLDCFKQPTPELGLYSRFSRRSATTSCVSRCCLNMHEDQCSSSTSGSIPSRTLSPDLQYLPTGCRVSLNEELMPRIQSQASAATSSQIPFCSNLQVQDDVQRFSRNSAANAGRTLSPNYECSATRSQSPPEPELFSQRPRWHGAPNLHQSPLSSDFQVEEEQRITRKYAVSDRRTSPPDYGFPASSSKPSSEWGMSNKRQPQTLVANSDYRHFSSNFEKEQRCSRNSSFNACMTPSPDVGYSAATYSTPLTDQVVSAGRDRSSPSAFSFLNMKNGRPAPSQKTLGACQSASGTGKELQSRLNRSPSPDEDDKPKRKRGRPPKKENVQSPQNKCSKCYQPVVGRCLNTPCGHFFHEKCMEQWLTKPGVANRVVKICPECGLDLDEKRLNPLFL